MKYCLKAKNHKHVHKLYSTNLMWKNVSLLPRSCCKGSIDDSFQFSTYSLMCRVNSQISNYRNSTTYRQKLTEDDRQDINKQTTNAQNQTLNKQNKKKTVW